MQLANVVVFLCMAACTVEHRNRSLSAEVQYRWDGSRVLCSKTVDDGAVNDGLTKVGAELDYAAAHRTAALLHGHVPLSSISFGQLSCMLQLADERDIELVTFGEFVDGSTPRPALALSFDDDAIDAWYAVRNLFTSRNARVTFFVTGYGAWTDEQKGKLAELSAAGHDVQPHGTYHLNAVDYVAEHGIEDYLEREVLPSIAQLEDAGYPVHTYAFPYGATTDEITEAVLEYVPQVRVTRSACPY